MYIINNNEEYLSYLIYLFNRRKMIIIFHKYIYLFEQIVTHMDNLD